MQRKTQTLKRKIKKHSQSIRKKEEPFGEDSILLPYSTDELIPMGSTLLNLAMSDCVEGGAKKGTMINIIGASHGGKTILALTSFAETNRTSSFDNYHFIYDDVERANSFNMPKLFGISASSKIEAPRPGKEDEFSVTVQHFHANIDYHLKKEEPFIYVLDSFDALDALEDQKKTNEMISALEKGKETAGTYGMAKAKASSSILRNVTSGLNRSKSALFIVSQVRDNVDPMSFKKETRSGGRALKFYASHEMWMRSIKTIKKRDTPIGNTVRVEVSKNKLTGKSRTVEFDIYYDYGIDDIGSCIDYLIKQGRWAGGGASKIDHREDFIFPPCTKTKMIDMVSFDKEAQQQLKKLVGIEWKKFEDSLKTNRKSKYD